MAEDNLVKFRCLSAKGDFYAKNPPTVTLANGREMYMLQREKGMKCAKSGTDLRLEGSKGNQLGPLCSAVPSARLSRKKSGGATPRTKK